MEILEDIGDLGSKRLKELNLICEKKGLSKTGSKSEIIRRIELLMKEKESNVPVVEWNKRGRKPKKARKATSEMDVDDNVPDNTYGALKKHELKQMCVARNLPALGNIPVLVTRLLENDAILK